jgi:AmmeMemoRadiSam system protein B
MDRPKLRRIEAIPVEIDNRRLVYLRDPFGFAVQSLLLPHHIFFVVSHFDGQHSILDIQEAFVRQYGELLAFDTIRELIAQLDSHYYLEGERFASREREIRAAFAALPVRPLAHAGTCYDADPDQFRAQLNRFFTDPAGPGMPRQDGRGPALRAIIAPHIDLRVGGPCYAWAYRELAERSDAEVFILLGTSHAGGSHPFILTEKDFETPLGTVRADRPFIARLREAYGHELFRDEILHRNEHSLEFQALFLQYIFGARRSFTIVPILVGSFHDMIRQGRPPVEDPAVGEFIAVLRRTMAEDSRPLCLVAGADFAHVGLKFGDAEGLDPNFLRRVEVEDQALISTLERADAAAFFAEIAKDQDRRRICGFSPMYTLLSTVSGPGGHGRLLRYDRTEDPQTRSAVTFASLVFD